MQEKESVAGKLAVWSYRLVTFAVLVLVSLYLLMSLSMDFVVDFFDLFNILLAAAMYVAPVGGFLLAGAALCLRADEDRSPSMEYAKAALVIGGVIMAVMLIGPWIGGW